MYYVFLIMQREVRVVKSFDFLSSASPRARCTYRLAAAGATLDSAGVRLKSFSVSVKSYQVVPERRRLAVANERLRGAIVDLGLSLDEVAERLGVASKTVERWINEPERKPYRRFQYATASLLKCEVSYLWPDERTSAEVTASGNAELVRLYPHRSVVMQTLWPKLYSTATRQFDLLVYSGFWLTEDATFHRIVKEKSADGVPIRFMLGEPTSPAVAVRGEDEGIGGAMAGKIRNALLNYGPLFGLPGVEFRLHSTTLYNSIYRADDEMLTNGHLYGVGAYMAPVLHLRRVPGGELFDSYAESVERVWESARPITSPADCEGTD